MTTSAVSLTACTNCGAALDGGFCGRCGQKAAAINPSFGEFLHELIHEIAHVDGKIVQSIRLLLTKPGFLSREHFEGRRARYVSPIRLYLICSVLYFGVVAFAPFRGVRISCASCPPETKAQTEREMREALPHWAPRAMFVLVPALAGLVALAAPRSGRNYPQHLYFAMHVHAAWYFAGAVAAAAGLIKVPFVTFVTVGVSLLYAIIYLALAFRRAYDASIARAILGATAVAVTYLLAVVVALAAILLFPVVLRR